MRIGKKAVNRIIAVVLIILGLIMGVTRNDTKHCIGGDIFIALGLSPWSNGTDGTHYPAVMGIFSILIGIGVLNATMEKKGRLWFWAAVVLLLIVINLGGIA